MHEPERLSELRGITSQGEGDRASVHRTERDAPADGLSERAWSADRDHGAAVQALARQRHRSLKENPYLLCDPYYDVDFRLADGLAIELGLSLLSDDRTDAGIVYTLTFNLENGHTFHPAS